MSDTETAGDGTAALRRLVLGETGFERAVVWSAVGFALSYLAFDVTGALGVSPGATAGVLAGVTSLCALGFAATGGGALPTAVLASGPLAGTLLRAIGPEPYVSPFAAGGPALTAVTAPLALAGAVALATGAIAAAVGLLARRIAAARER
ncbi:hypothetical protein EXE46_06450 [Halorubrum sp. GN11_10-6_MGM]|uniref:hypothetical protein n=1 Tax=Halorubrum sp. GN11_10-6_MGM TaxID=2518112 RepID=UPI0010F44097|nr:hypothetical protein [Halorubrum sp. GN11_10-6_MGM]TKX74852.1 hypothetical protein EXE46_06450 [Halorubrum sp. GN11_10-6_MGM]